MKGYFQMLVSALSLLPLVYLLLVSIPLSVIDLRERRLPNRLVVPALALTLFCQIGLAFFDWQRVLVSFAVTVLVFAGMVVANHYGWVGMGDAKLTTALVWASTWFIGLWSIAIFPIALVLALAFFFIAIALKFEFKAVRLGVPMGPWMYASLIILLAIAH